MLKFFSPAIAVAALAASVTGLAEAQRNGSITFYDGANYSGASITIDNDETNLRQLGFNNRASSFRIQGNERWEVCVDSNFNGSCQVVDEDMADMGRWAFNNRISSVRLVRSETNRRGRQRGVTLYAGPNFTGRSVDITEHTDSLVAYNFNDAAQSIEVHSGEWTICQHEDFGGRCSTIDRDVRNLRNISLTRQITSLTPRDITRNQPGYGNGSGYSSGYGANYRLEGGVTGIGSVFFPEPTLNGYPIAECSSRNGRECGRSVADQLCRAEGYRDSAYHATSRARSSQAYYLDDRRTSYTNGVLVDVLCVR